MIAPHWPDSTGQVLGKPPMSVTMFLLLQSGVDWAAAADRRLLDSDARRCAAGVDDEIVVCARDDERHRLRPLDDGSGLDGAGKAEFGIGDGVNVAAELEQAPFDLGPRIMIRLKTPF